MAGVAQQGIALSPEVGSDAALPMRSPEAFGAGFGSAVAGAGGQLLDSDVRAVRDEQQRKQQVSATEAGVTAAAAGLELDKNVGALEDHAAPGAAGHVEAVTDLVGKSNAQVLDSITDPHVRREYQALLAERGARVVSDADAWARGQRLKYGADNIGQAADLSANRLMSNPDHAVLGEELKNLSTVIGNQGLSADVAQRALREQMNVVGTGYARGLTKANPAAAGQWLAGGEAEAMLDPKTRATLIDEAETEGRVQAADARRQLAQQAAQVRVDAQALSTQINQGVLVRDDQVAGIASRAQALAAVDPALGNVVEGLRYDDEKLKDSRRTDKWTLADWSSHVDPLAAKVASGKASAAEQRELKILSELRPAKEARFVNDPRKAAAAAGIPVPDFDPDDPTPQSVAAQASWAEAWQKTAHLPEAPYEPKTKLDQYRQQASQGPVAQLEIANELASTWGANRAASIIRQIGGDAKNDMIVMAGLEPRMASLYRKGLDQLKAPGFKFDEATAETLFQPFRRGLPPDPGLQNSIFNAAKAIVAGYAAEQGKTQAGGGNFDHVFSVAVHRAVGMLGDPASNAATGGFVQWNGRYAALPPTMSRDDLQQRLSRAGPQDWVAAAVDPRGNPVAAVPHYRGPDGKLKPYTKSAAARFGGMQLETVSPGIYRLIGSDGSPAVDQHGQPWQFDVSRLPPSHLDAQIAAHGYIRR